MNDMHVEKGALALHEKLIRASEKLEIVDLIDCYADSIDEDRLEDWPEFFTEECIYRIIARENYDENLPLAIIRCESKDMLKDRVTAIRQTMTYAPRHVRHFLSGVKCSSNDGGRSIAVRANFCVAQSKIGAFSTLHCIGRYVGTVVRENGALRFRQLDCVFDTGLIDNSVIYPL